MTDETTSSVHVQFTEAKTAYRYIIHPDGQDEIFRCYKCNLPFARLQNGAIVIESRHHGEKHTNSISVWDLVLLVIKSVASIERSTPDE